MNTNMSMRMTMRHGDCRQRLEWIAFMVCLASSAGFAPAEEKRLPAIDDLYRADSPTELAVAPDQQRAAYARHWVDQSTRRYRHALWRVKTSAENRQPFEPGEPDGRAPIFSPDGEWIAFLSTRPFPDGSPAVEPVPPYSDPATDIWLIAPGGGRAIPLAGKDKAYGRVLSDGFYGRVAFSPDRKRLVFVADDGEDPRTPEEIARNVRIVRDDQGEGYEGYGPAQIWVADLAEEPGDVAATRVTRLTHDDVWYGDPQWSPDGKFIVVHANRTSDRESVRYSINKNFDLWRIDLDGDHTPQQITTGPGPEVSPRLSPDGRRIVCLSCPRKGPHMDVFNLLLIELGEAGAPAKVLFNHHGPNADQAPHWTPPFPLPRDCWLDADHFHYQATVGFEKARRQIIDARTLGAPAAVSDARLDARDKARARLTPPGNAYLRERRTGGNEVVRWKSTEGLQIDGALNLPPQGVGTRPYPLVVFPHGGPHSRAALGGSFTTQILNAHGYAVFQPNFRGSAGYGREFLDADRFDFGGGDMRDILTGIEHLVEEGVVDPRRQFVYGISYGGFMTSWLVGQTRQFRAAIAQNAVTDLHAMWGLSDLQSWTEWEFGGLPWQVADLMRARSPLTFAPRVRTPTLILHSANDRRCPLPMGTMFYRALKKTGVETEMVIYPDEGHAIRQLPHQEDVIRRVLDWFARYDLPK
ncbi:MAG: S9 family peptidase [Verrucomicrobiota bacterium]|nr:S9 family peptidase [Verrucomicrobiota bacterium]